MERVFYFCAILGSVFVVLQFLASLIGLAGGDGDFDGDLDGVADSESALDASHDSDGTSFLRAFSIRSITSGVAFFGLTGFALVRAGYSETVALTCATVVGLIAIYTVYRLMRMLSSFNHDGSVRMNSAVGAKGQVYLRIPAARSGVGKASILQQERLMEYDAITDGPELEQNAPVVVLEVLSPSTLLVKRSFD